MKRIQTLVLGLSLVAGAAEAQSYLVKSNGMVLNIDLQGQVHDRTHFILPYQIRASGGQFYVDQNRQLTTVDEGGFFYRHDRRSLQAPRDILYTGHNYFVAKDGTPWTFDQQGTPYIGTKDNTLKVPLLKGGNWFTIAGYRREPPRLFVVSERGALNAVGPLEGLDLTKIKDVGGNWFTLQDGTVYTISAEGYVYSKRDVFPRIPAPELKGGNFFIVNNRVVTIAADGLVADKGNLSTFGRVARVGYNYFVTQDAKLITINERGELANRTGRLDLSSIGLTTFSAP